MMDSQLMQGRLDDPLWRLQHLYWIENKAGRMQRFTLNAAQLRLHRAMWNRNAVLKARQLGISTYVAMLMLDCCLFTPNFHAGIIDKSLPDAEQKLAKVRFAWENLDYAAPDADAAERALAYLGGLIKQRTGALKRGELHPVGDARTRMAFANGSDIRLGTTLRGGTLQLLHVSELAHVSVHAPWRAREIRTGAINTVPADGRIILESTHEGGRYGVNYEMMQQAMENSAKDELSPLDFRFFFFSWFDNPVKHTAKIYRFLTYCIDCARFALTAIFSRLAANTPKNTQKCNIKSQKKTNHFLGLQSLEPSGFAGFRKQSIRGALGGF